ncbi:hypothetical protein O0I10_002179 [Lichtheimia ornata]|uniref:Telomere length regulation protein conserved domain-containing protein n=1 Tax=Lichtheimia ornata TaxID=688661 RepID=A0AAD7Y1T4_9FUNG|nr:uncharacterized protein O0I10_002179 [Lichtheimia ornata]KAJ8661851.1 hypothetical protein O0I10_002179 [Lichtheimia ornata]
MVDTDKRLTNAIRELDNATLPDKQPTRNSIAACIEEPVAWLRNDMDPQERLTFVQHAAWKHHVWTVCQQVIPSWSFIFTATSASLVTALEATLFGVGIECERGDQDALLCNMAQISLPIILDCLQVVDNARLDALHLYERLLKRSISEPLFPAYMHYNGLDDPRFFCSLICSFPAKLANAFGLEKQSDWYQDTNFYPLVAKQLGHAVRVESNQSAFAGELLGKMMRQGYTDIIVSTLYPIALARIRQDPSKMGQAWADLWEAATTMSTTEKLSEMMLLHVRHAINQETAGDIQKAAFGLSMVLFSMHDKQKRLRLVEEFLSVAFIQMAKKRVASTVILRIAIAAAVHAMGIEYNEQERLLVLDSIQMVDRLIQKLVDVWADPVFIMHGSHQEQEYITSGLLIAAGYLPKEQLQHVVFDTSLMAHIHRWFQSKDMTTAKFGVVVAESISSLVDKEENWFHSGILDDEANKHFSELKKLNATRDALALVPLTEEGDVAYIVESEESDMEEEEELDPDAIVSVDDQDDTETDESDLDAYPMEEESSEDEEGAYGQDKRTKKSRARKPVYILDLINYLKDHDDPVKLEIGLKSAEELIRQKTGYGTELEDSAVVLARRLMDIPESYELPEMKIRQQHAITALIVAVPDRVAGFLIDALYGRNTSIEIKQVVLASIILGASESKHAAPHIEFERLSLEPPEQKIGKIRVFSRRMEVEKNKSTQRNRLSGLAGSCFFFPLLVGWWEGSQGRTKFWLGRDTILAERFVMALNVIMHCATNTPDKRRIVMEYFEFALSLRYANIATSVVQALLTGIDIILNVSYQHQEKLLLQDYTLQLAATKNWLEDIMELVNENELKEKAIRLLARLMQLSTMD